MKSSVRFQTILPKTLGKGHLINESGKCPSS